MQGVFAYRCLSGGEVKVVRLLDDGPISIYNFLKVCLR